MKQLNELAFPDSVRYAKNHEWAQGEGEMLVVGISDYAQDQLGDIVFVELPAVGSTFEQEAVFGTLESVKAVSEIYMPVAGKMVAINETLRDAPDRVNADPYGAGWLIKIAPRNMADVALLMDAQAYLAMLKGT
jgi:glycine cleavage system H protein